jgi:transposase InsO family protein
VTEEVGLQDLWPGILSQKDLTHIPSFGWQYYVHLSVDTYSGYIYASAHAGEATKHVITHCLASFDAIGKPQQLKTNNGPEYTSTAFSGFVRPIRYIIPPAFLIILKGRP